MGTTAPGPLDSLSYSSSPRCYPEPFGAYLGPLSTFTGAETEAQRVTETFLKARREWIAAGVGGKQAWTRCSPSSWASLETRGQGWDESGPWGHAGGCRGTMDDAGVPLYIGAPCVSLPSSHLEDWLISSPHPCRERRPSLVSPRFTQWPQGGRVGTRELPPPEDADAWSGGRGRCSGSVCSM